MNTTTKPLTCDRPTSGYRRTCGKPAAMALPSKVWAGGERMDGYEMVCKVHVAGLRRRTFSWEAESLTELTDAVVEVYTECAARQERAQAAEAEEKDQRRTVYREARRAAAWQELKVEMTSTLLVEDDRLFGEPAPAVSVHIHPAGADHRSWGSVSVRLDVEGPGWPAVVKVDGGSPMTLNPEASVLLADAIVQVQEWADALNVDAA